MTSRDLAYWIQGYLELTPAGQGLTPDQVEIIRKHVALVFIHDIDPSQGDEAHQQLLNETHAGKPPSKPWPNRPPGARC